MHHSFYSITVVIYILTCLYTGHHIRQIVVPNSKKNITLTRKIFFFGIYFVLSLSIFLGFTERFGTTIQNIGCLLWGFYFYFLLFCFLSDLFLGIMLIISTWKRKQFVTESFTRKTYIISVACCLLLLVTGAIYAKIIRIADYNVTIDTATKNNSKDIKITMVSDTHLGKQLGLVDAKKWVTKINETNPDLVCFCGDIFNDSIFDVNDLDEIAKEFSKINSTYGTYSCLGNHDTYGIIDSYGNITGNAKDFFEKSNITILHDEYVLIDNSFYLVGRKDASPSMDESNYSCMDLSDILKGASKDTPIILLDHRPQRFGEAIDNNVSLLLAGHTHLGQLFPANILTNITYECDYGLYEKGDFKAIVSSGLGYWGPPLRIGSSCEIVVVNVTFN